MCGYISYYKPILKAYSDEVIDIQSDDDIQDGDSKDDVWIDGDESDEETFLGT